MSYILLLFFQHNIKMRDFPAYMAWEDILELQINFKNTNINTWINIKQLLDKDQKKVHCPLFSICKEMW